MRNNRIIDVEKLYKKVTNEILNVYVEIEQYKVKFYYN